MRSGKLNRYVGEGDVWFFLCLLNLSHSMTELALQFPVFFRILTLLDTSKTQPVGLWSEDGCMMEESHQRDRLTFTIIWVKVCKV